MNRPKLRIASAYIAFAILAGAVNLITQWIFIRISTFSNADRAFVLSAAVVAGTAAGMITKYAFDKRFIFNDPATGIGAHARRLSLYTTMGLLTTFIFWGAEFVFALFGKSEMMMYAGGCIGLMIGYAVKFQLDRRFVFVTAVMAGGSSPP